MEAANMIRVNQLHIQITHIHTQNRHIIKVTIQENENNIFFNYKNPQYFHIEATRYDQQHRHFAHKYDQQQLNNKKKKKKRKKTTPFFTAHKSKCSPEEAKSRSEWE